MLTDSLKILELLGRDLVLDLESRSSGLTPHLMLFPLYHPLSLCTAQQTISWGGEEGRLRKTPALSQALLPQWGWHSILQL